MVTNITSLTGNGLKDWLIQRVSAIYLAVYTLFLMTYFVMHPQLQYIQWYSLFQTRTMQVATLLALVMFSFHAWIGIWTVTTDYIKGTALRLSIQMLIVLWLLSQFVWGIMIVWG